MTPTSLVAYLVLFAGGAFLFLFVSLLLGRLLRAQAPTPEKLRSYECGEPAVGTSQVQFDLRFYVVALVFLVFDVEVAFFFPWAVVFGKAAQTVQLATVAAKAAPDAAAQSLEAMHQKYDELVGTKGARPAPETVAETARRLTVSSLVDLAVFFAVLLVGFAYVWNQGDLDWVRAIGRSAEASLPARGEVLRP